MHYTINGGTFSGWTTESPVHLTVDDIIVRLRTWLTSATESQPGMKILFELLDRESYYYIMEDTVVHYVPYCVQ